MQVKKPEFLKLALGGVFTALFVITGFLGISDSRMVISVCNIVKIIIISIYSYREKFKDSIVFAMSCFLISFLFLPFNVSIIHSVTSIVCGIGNGIALRKYKFRVCILLAFLLNIITFVYEMIITFLLTGTNILIAYTKSNKELLLQFFNDIDFVADCVISNLELIAVIIFTIDLFVSSLFILLINKLIILRLKPVTKN